MNVVILAAGMASACSPRCQKCCTRWRANLLSHVISAARALSPTTLCVIYAMRRRCCRACWQLQTWCSPNKSRNSVPTAVAQAASHLDDAVPSGALWRRASDYQQHAATADRQRRQRQTAVLTVDLPDPTGYGRIVREHDKIVSIVEQKDASPEQRNPGMQHRNHGGADGAAQKWLAGLSNNNAQGEYYLTDIVASAVADGTPAVSASQPP